MEKDRNLSLEVGNLVEANGEGKGMSVLGFRSFCMLG